MTVKEVGSDKKVDPALWDKLKPWRTLKEAIERLLMESKGGDASITLEHGLQLMETLRHSSKIRAMSHFTSSTADVILTHYKLGSVKTNCTWEVMMGVNREVTVSVKKFETQRIISQVIFIPTHYVYVAFCSDLKLVVFKDYKSNCDERSTTPCITTLLCMAYNKDTDELITGGIGELLRWTLNGIERGSPPLPGRKFETSITREDWVRDMKIDRKYKRILALCGFNICVVNYETDKQTHFIESRHIGPLCCCSFYKMREYFITAGMDGCIKVWNAGAMKQIHEFVGHYGKVTSLQISRADPLLLSSSLDGSVHVWRLDNFQWVKRLDVGEKIYSMKLLGHGNLYCQTVNDVLLYSLNQFYNTFSTVESTVSCLKRVSWPGYISCIIASTEDGSVRFLSPVTGSTITIIFPLPTFQVFNHFSYNRKKNILFTLTPNGSVLIFDCSTNPCMAVELREPNLDDQILCLTLVPVQMRRGVAEDMLTFVGHANGEVSLLDSDTHTLSSVIKLHLAGVICLETVEGFSRGRGGCVGRLVSAGANNNVKVTDVLKSGNEISLRPRVTIQFDATPLYVSMFENMVCAVLQPYRVAMVKVDLAAKKFIDGKLHALRHSTVDDHTAPVSGLDCCSALRLFVTAANDGFVKIWDAENNLVRELSFGETLQGVCFANTRGDILAGFERHVVSVSICRYLPGYLLEAVARKNFRDEQREDPLPFNNKQRLSFDPQKLPTFSTNPERRRSQLKTWQLTSSEDRLAIEEGSWRILEDVAQHCFSTRKVEEKQKAMNLLGMIFPDTNNLIHRSSFQILAGKVKQQIRMAKKAKKVSSANQRDWRAALAENIRLTELKLEEKMAVMKAESKPHRCKLVTAEDVVEELPPLQPPDPRIVRQRRDWKYLYGLFNKWMIPVDGHVPNSVVRKRFGQKFGLSEEDKHGTRIRMRSMKYRYQSKRRRAPMRRRMRKMANKMGRDHGQTSEKARISSSTGPASSGGSSSSSSSAATGDSKTGQKVDTAKQKSQDYKFKSGQVEAELRTRRGSMAAKDKMKGRKLDGVEEDANLHTFIEDIHVKGAGIFLRIMKEEWFPKGVNMDKFNIIATLLSIIETDDPIVNKSACNYLLDIRADEGLPNQIELDLVKALLGQLSSKRHSVQKESIWMLGELGYDSKDIIMALMPKLVDNSPTLRNEATRAIQKILGVTNKEDLLEALEARGFVKGFMDNLGNEEEIFQRLSRQAEGVLFPVIENRLMGWLDDTSNTYAESSSKKHTNVQSKASMMTKRKRSDSLSKERKVYSRAERQDTSQEGMKGATTHRRRSSTVKPPAAFIAASPASKSKSSGTGGSKRKSTGREATVGSKKRTQEKVRKGRVSSFSVPSSLEEEEEETPRHMPGIEETEMEVEEEEEEGPSGGQKSYDITMDVPDLPDLPDFDYGYDSHRLGRMRTQLPSLPSGLADTVVGAMKQAGMGAGKRRLTPLTSGRAGTRLSGTLLLTEEEAEMVDKDADVMSLMGLEEELVDESSIDAMVMGGMGGAARSRSAQRQRRSQFMDREEDLLTRQLVDEFSPQGDLLWNYDNEQVWRERGVPQTQETTPGTWKDKEKAKNIRGSAKEGSSSRTALSRGADQKRFIFPEDPRKLRSLSVCSDEKLTSGVPSTPVDHFEPSKRLNPRHSFIHRHYGKTDSSKKTPVKASAGNAPTELPVVAGEATQAESETSSPKVSREESMAESDSALVSRDSQDQFTENLSQQLTSDVNEISDSGIESGISQDMSETSSYKGGGGAVGTLVDRGLPSLSPVKSVLEMPDIGLEEKRPHSTPKLPEPPEGWRDFFDRPSAQERKRLQMVRKDFAEGKTKPVTLALPPISYVKDKFTFRAGNSGFRLLQRVTIKDKELKQDTGKRMIDPLPAKLGIKTVSESEGSSKYGILHLEWTTDIPVPLWRPKKGTDNMLSGHHVKPPETSHVLTRLPPIGDQLIDRLEGRSVFTQPSGCQGSHVYRWESPLPPAPRLRETCLQPLSPVKSHAAYCKYYSLARQGMHRYTSEELLPLRLERHEKALKRTLRFYCRPGR